MYDGSWIMTMMYDDDGHGCDPDDRLMMPVEPMFHVHDDSYLDDRDT